MLKHAVNEMDKLQDSVDRLFPFCFLSNIYLDRASLGNNHVFLVKFVQSIGAINNKKCLHLALKSSAQKLRTEKCCTHEVHSYLRRAPYVKIIHDTCRVRP